MGFEGAFLCDIYISYVVCLIDVAYSSYAHMDEASERVYVWRICFICDMPHARYVCFIYVYGTHFSYTCMDGAFELLCNIYVADVTCLIEVAYASYTHIDVPREHGYMCDIYVSHVACLICVAHFSFTCMDGASGCVYE